MEHKLFFERLNTLLCKLTSDGRFGIAFSGGLDSRFLAHATRLLGLKPILIHASGPHMSPSESAWARQWARERGFAFEGIHVNPLTLPAVACNAADRCYHCKRALFERMMRMLNGELDFPLGEVVGSFPGMPLCDGSNLSDRLGYRPGMRAIHELGVRSPLAEAGLDKQCIRKLADETGLDWPDQPARPCLLTRFAYGLKPTAEMLEKLAAAEDTIAGLLGKAVESEGAGTGNAGTEGGRTGRAETAVADFRLRVPEEGCTVLHLASAFSEEIQQAVADAVVRHGLPRPRIEQVATLSGYYDAQRAGPQKGPELDI